MKKLTAIFLIAMGGICATIILSVVPAAGTIFLKRVTRLVPMKQEPGYARMGRVIRAKLLRFKCRMEFTNREIKLEQGKAVSLGGAGLY